MPVTSQPSPRVLANRRNAQKGGLARAAKYSAEQRREWSAKGGISTAELYGPELKHHANTLRQFVGRYRKPAAECKLKGRRRKKAG